ncbi:MAG: Rieske (2Fe-2S) domain-containing protein [Acidobacteria bacterium OLB17]|nr:MAG: Rieske (2Fe-2S) domain-containing protein [Acidobacteria bacterium OLB17]MCZ2391485.1 ubiquinol-cytochrome c reductase iron-sulfur subunit [Acidobacteriota bacterium]
MKKQSEFDEARAKVLDAQSEADELLNQKPKNIELLGERNPSRRSLLRSLGISAVLVALGGQAFAMLRSLFPNVLYEPPQKFKLGSLDKFTDGGTFLEADRLFVFRDKNTFHAISAACTHLGCTVKMVKLNQPKKVTVGGKEIEEQVEFHCPCHGSKYYGDGTNFAGPAPRPLDCFNLEVSPDDGQLIVDKATRVSQDFRLTV